MSIIVTVAAVGSVTAGASVFAGLAAAAAAGLGLKAATALTEAEEEQLREQRLSQDSAELLAAAEQVELSTDAEQALEQVVAERCELRFSDDQLELAVRRDIRGKVTVRAHGHGMSRAEVEERAQRFLGLLQQQVAYRRVMQELRKHGFAAVQEQRAEDGTVHVRIKRKKG